MKVNLGFGLQMRSRPEFPDTVENPVTISGHTADRVQPEDCEFLDVNSLDVFT